jgi:hypothetical protein
MRRNVDRRSDLLLEVGPRNRHTVMAMLDAILQCNVRRGS